jgi:hypothetical protein
MSAACTEAAMVKANIKNQNANIQRKNQKDMGGGFMIDCWRLTIVYYLGAAASRAG